MDNPNPPLSPAIGMPFYGTMCWLNVIVSMLTCPFYLTETI